MYTAIHTGKFSGVVHHSFLEPMLPIMETLQTNIISHFEAITTGRETHATTIEKLARKEMMAKYVYAD